ncbi:cysteine protease [Lysobacter arseniciresistens ZS79]|uniref:Cysteine protease n=1 Tax=Lysobacter arseniciresistens ZS79 TaxID=913325 RepID=A0A0A0F319_9GAMM|nr:alpha/beta hydrolase [Lysobacter arseniciresistens]KGM56738.1 cysteine protease [Lysobacter arseniciresistens ZS79]
MHTTRFLPAALAAAAAALALAGCGPASDAPASAGARFGDIAFEPCSLQGAAGVEPVSAQCGTFEVAENPAQPDGRRIDLRIAWLPANKGSAVGTGDPVFFLAGGPGQAATEHAAAVQRMLGDVAKTRDIVLVDQRGTGGSNPLECVDANGEPMAFGPALESPDRIAAFARECAAGLADHADPRFYTTTDAVRDLEAVRAALGVEQVNLVGVSYGTRVAQQYAATHPDRVRTIVLDGVAPNSLVVGGEFAQTLEDALALQSAKCRELPACARRYPVDMRERLRTVMERLEAAPVEVDYRHPRTGRLEHGTVTADAVGGLAFMFSYAPQTASLLPLVIDEAAQGRYAPLMSLVEMNTLRMEGQMTRGMQWSVICAEDAGRWQPGSGGDDTLMGDAVAEGLFAACDGWPHGSAPEGFHAPFASDLPVLLLSGELDPVTPPRYGEQVVEHLPNGRHLVLAGQGHNVSWIGCAPKLVGQFIEGADAAALDASCLDTLSYVPPFVTFNGWSP